MFKFLLMMSVLLLGHFVQAQVKYGDNPKVIGASSLLELESTNKALLLTRLHDTTKILFPVNGMMIYDSASGTIMGYESNRWNSWFSYLRSNKELPLLQQRMDAILDRRTVKNNMA